MEQQILNTIKNFFENNFEKYSIEIAFLYGSYVRGHPLKESDIDIAIVFSKEIDSDNKIFEILTNLSVKLSELTKKNVDVINIYPDFRHPMLYYNAIVLGEPIFVKERKNYFNLRMLSIEQMEDFSIFGTMWQLEISERLLRNLKYA